MLRTVKITLVKHNYRRHVIHLACNQKAIKKRKFNLRKINGYNKERPVKICSYDMRLTRQIRRLADHIVATFMHTCDSRRIFQCNMLRNRFNADSFWNLRLKINHVTYCHRIGRITILQTDLTPQHCRKQFPLRKNGKHIMTSRVLYYCRLSFHNHTAKNTKKLQISKFC